METTKTIKEEGVIVVMNNTEPVAMIRRHEKTGHQIVYKVVEAGAEEISDLMK